MKSFAAIMVFVVVALAAAVPGPGNGKIIPSQLSLATFFLLSLSPFQYLGQNYANNKLPGNLAADKRGKLKLPRPSCYLDMFR